RTTDRTLRAAPKPSVCRGRPQPFDEEGHGGRVARRYPTRHAMRLVAVATVGVLVMLFAWHPARVAVQTLALLPAVVPSAPFDPLAAFTPAPAQTEQAGTY